MNMVARPLTWARRMVALAATSLLAALAAAPVSADDGLTTVPENGSPGLLWLTSDPFPVEFPPLSPGDAVWWQVGAHLRDEDLGALTLTLASSGELVTLPGGLLVTVRSCRVPWQLQPPTCPTGSTMLLSTVRLADVGPGDVMALGQITPQDSTWVMFTLQLPADAGNEMQNRSGRVGAGFTAVGDATTATTTPTSPPPSDPVPNTPPPRPFTTPSTTPGETPSTVAPSTVPPGLPRTGGDVATSLLVAIGAIGAGLTLAGLARRRSAVEDRP
jgi:LPXTG-motif cell wall-anchored protein